ncbi:MAG: hypothetical protein Kow0042_04300 [Calditrichia bacterium]
MVQYYHSRGDTFEKVNRKYLAEAAAVVSILIHRLANDETFSFPLKDTQQTIEMLKRFKLDERLKRQKEWIFGNE